MTIYDFFTFILIGIFTGTLSGLLGVGGGIVVVPALVFTFAALDFPMSILMHLAAGTSLAVMIFTSIASLHSHIKHGVTIYPIFKKLIIGIIVGVISGAIVADFLHSGILRIIFAIFIILIALRILSGAEPKPHRQLPGKLLTNAVSFVIGFKSGLLGAGGGVLSMPFLTACNVNIRDAVGVSAACSLLISLVGTISLMITGLHEPNLPAHSIGFIYLPAFIGIGIMSPIFARIGAYYSYKIPAKKLKMIFAVFILVVGIKLLIGT